MAEADPDHLVVDDPGHGVGFVITDVYAYVAVHADGDEGIIGATINGIMRPLVAADRTRLEQLKPYAQAMARRAKQPIRLVRFTTREEVEVIEPWD